MIDVTFDFTTDTPGYWDGFWERKSGLGGGGADPDCVSPTLKRYHQILWSRDLPNGEKMDLKIGSKRDYLTWKNHRFASDSIIVEFRYKKNLKIIEQAKEKKKEKFKAYYEELLRKSYTIGGMIIFPKHRGSMNQDKGTNWLISDRWDLTLECIRRYYNGENSPLYKTIDRDRWFYQLFLDFKGYVDFFFLQDAVTDDYSSVHIWCGNAEFTTRGLPQTYDDYERFIKNEYEFLSKRNARIKEFSESHLKKE